MPSRYWRHDCGCYRADNLSAQPECSRCGAPGEYVGFRLRAIEAMSAYIKVFGLKPIGRHRRCVEEVMRPLFRRCEVCGGSGTVEIPYVIFSECPLCDGTRLVPNVPRPKITAARQQVLAEFPDAGSTWDENR